MFRSHVIGAPALTLIIACGGSTAATSDPATTLSQLSGTYTDPAPYAYGQAFGHRTFTFGDGAWTLDFTLALDPDMQASVFRFRTHGTYEVLRASASVDGAYDALFREDRKLLTLLTTDPGLIQAFGFAECGLEPYVEKDISAAGCSGWKPVAECSEDHDLLALTPDGGVRFGVRPPDNDMCTADRRPTALTPAVVPVP